LGENSAWKLTNDRQRGDFVAVVDEDRTFRGLIDRSAVLESLANEFLRQADLKKNLKTLMPVQKIRSLE
jgi:hypothetical protein